MSRPGRKRSLNAKRRKTTRAERSPIDHGTHEVQLKRLLLTGETMTSLDHPLDVMLARELITREERDAGDRFAAISWRLFGTPHKGCDAIYERMIAGGLDDLGPAPTRLEEEDKAERLAKLRREHNRLVRLLQADGESRRLLNAVQNVCQHLRMPRCLLAIGQEAIRPTDLRDLADILRALRILADDQQQGAIRKVA